MTAKRGVFLAGFALAATSGTSALAQTPISPAALERTVLEDYCVSCHNDSRLTGGLSLERIDLSRLAANAEDSEVWEKVVRKLRTRAMPPPGRQRPSEQEYESVATCVETVLDAAAAAAPNPGRRPAVHRLNRAEYTNAIRDLFALEVDGTVLLGSARDVEFKTLHDPERMPGQRSMTLDWPYVEGLRLDEARHPLTTLATGVYGQDLPNQNGAPIRLVVPWQYGSKSIKSIVSMTFMEQEPDCTWKRAAPNEYGFYANVNPEVDHPRWSQAQEWRLGEPGRRETLLFNGYVDQVAGLYAGMDLRVNY